jgi:hypothetical protein
MKLRRSHQWRRSSIRSSRGEVYDRKLTFREGLTSWQIVQMLNNATELSGEALTSIPEEGSLLPETYHYMKTDTRQNVIEQMQAAMKKAQDDLWPTRVPDLPVVNMSEVMVLASIVEKETGVPDERRKVAGVFINRLKRGMPLQSDPTAIYALTKGEIKDDGMGPLGRRLLRKDLEIDSPYNTYKYPGLPPGPICNPGRESIAAVLNPETHNYVYFVADGTGRPCVCRNTGRARIECRQVAQDQGAGPVGPPILCGASEIASGAGCRVFGNSGLAGDGGFDQRNDFVIDRVLEFLGIRSGTVALLADIGNRLGDQREGFRICALIQKRCHVMLVTAGHRNGQHHTIAGIRADTGFLQQEIERGPLFGNDGGGQRHAVIIPCTGGMQLAQNA